MKLLVVDDEPVIRRLVTRVLRDEASVWEASNQREAIAIFKKGKFDVVLVDVNLGADNGLDLAVKFRDLDPLVQVTVMSGDPANEEKVRQAGLGPMLLKPFTSEELRTRLPI